MSQEVNPLVGSACNGEAPIIWLKFQISVLKNIIFKL